MESLGLLDMAVIMFVSVGGAIIVAYGFWLISTRRLAHQYAGVENIAPTFLFDGDNLRDMTPDAQILIKDAPQHMTDKESVLHVLGNRFPTLQSAMDALSRNTIETLTASDTSTISLELTDIDGLTQMKLLGTCAQDGLTLSAIAAQDALLSELTVLRTLTDKSPHLIWQQDTNGHLNWANDAYLNLSDALFDTNNSEVKSWPSDLVFADLHHDLSKDKQRKQRMSVDLPSQNGEAWYDVTSLKNGANALHFASNANAAVSAENEKRKSIQMFGRIFGQLSTGLATFDANCRLSMFNPALTELTNLSFEFLSGNPTMQMFLDRLRETRLLPEPKDYLKWRDQFPLTESSVKRTAYCENWEIADGQTFKVTGQPSRDNSYTFFFEDVSAEVSLTRRFRSDIQTSQGVLDALPEAIAVFSTNGTLVMSNKAYGLLWDVDHDTAVKTHDLRAEMSTWQSQCAAAPLWRDLRDFIGQSGDRGTWTDRAILDDGRQFTCKAQAISGGKTMISFTVLSRIRPRIHQSLSTPDPAIYGLKG
jgi:PAS domain-containing protein